MKPILRHGTRRRGAVALAVLAAALATGCATTLQWQPYPVEIDELAAADWIGDIDYLRSELPGRNPHFRDDPAMAAAFDPARRLNPGKILPGGSGCGETHSHGRPPAQLGGILFRPDAEGPWI